MTQNPDSIRMGIQFTETQDQHIRENYVSVQDLKGLWIPAEYLWAEDLKPNEKILMAFIFMADQKDHCYASNTTLAKWMQLPIQTVKNLIVALKKKGYLEQVSWNGRTRRVIRCLK